MCIICRKISSRLAKLICTKHNFIRTLLNIWPTHSLVLSRQFLWSSHRGQVKKTCSAVSLPLWYSGCDHTYRIRIWTDRVYFWPMRLRSEWAYRYIVVCIHTVVCAFAYLFIPLSLMLVVVVVGLLGTSSMHLSV